MPQLENGYTKIANEILDALCKTRIKGECRQLLDLILRKTYGYKKKSDNISTSQIIKATGLSRSSIYKARRWLKENNFITVSQKGDSNFLNYSFQKDYNKWVVSPKKETVSQLGTRVSPKTVGGVSPKKVHAIITKENITKENITKDNIAEQVKNLFDFFSSDIQNKISIYLDRVAKKNKSGIITEGRKLTLINELFNAKERCNDDAVFAFALDQTISRDACCIGYINAVIKNKKTQKPKEGGAAYHAYV